jgi:CDP-diacylglycerol--serine O-phosphatidyltransferase
MELSNRRTVLPRPNVRRVVVVVPSAFTLGNLFFGFWAIIAAFNRNFAWAAWFVVFAAVLDMLDGRLARLSKSGTRFGAELDSLADLVSFGMAPAMIMYFLEFAWAGKFAWVLCFSYVVAAAVRLARFNVLHDQQPTPGWFTGMPSPAAGVTLAVYYPFSQTSWFTALPPFLSQQKEGLVVLMVILSLLMVSTVKYPKFPPIGFRTVRGWLAVLVHLAVFAAAILAPAHLLFPMGVAYLLLGITRGLFLGLLERNDGTRTPGGGHDLSRRSPIARFVGPRRGERERMGESQ